MQQPIRLISPVARSISAIAPSILAAASLVLTAGAIPALATTSIDVSLVNPGASTVASGTPFELWVVADIAGARLTAVSYRLSVSRSDGDAGAYLSHRSADPNEANGLSYVSEISQIPFQNDLAHNFAIDAHDEVLTDLHFGEEPGSSDDGIDPNTNVILERIWITPTGTSAAGTISVTLSDLSAATTQGDPNGAFFDSM